VKSSDFIKAGKVRRARKDDGLARSLTKTAASDLIFLRRVKIDEHSARKILSSYYEVLQRTFCGEENNRDSLSKF
jgi:hypothetical protein